MAIIFITHDLNLIRGFADKVLVMYRGKVAEWGTAEQVFTAPAHPYTRGLIACRPPTDHRVRRLSTVNDEMTAPAQGDIIPKEERETRHRAIYEALPVLTVRRLRKEFAGAGMSLFRKKKAVTILHDLSMDVFKGETLGIVGESGCGKTTLARVILQLIPRGSGNISYKGTDITLLNASKLKALRKELQIVFQDPYSSLNPRISIGSAIMEPMKVHNLHGNNKNRRKKAGELLTKVGLSPLHFNRYPHEFSGGQRQRICIARALAVEPALIILDESVSALDVSIQAQILNLLNDLKRDFGLTYIFISHDLSVVRYMSDRVIVMSEGRIEEIGEADQVFMHPESEYTKQLITALSFKTN